MRVPRSHELSTPGTQLLHYKGGLYKILFLATHAHGGTVVVYERIDSDQQSREVYVRPVDEFQEYVSIKVPRFAVEDDD